MGYKEIHMDEEASKPGDLKELIGDMSANENQKDGHVRLPSSKQGLGMPMVETNRKYMSGMEKTGVLGGQINVQSEEKTQEVVAEKDRDLEETHAS